MNLFPSISRSVLVVFILVVFLLGCGPVQAGRSSTGLKAKIVDYRRHLSPRFKKKRRKSTRYIILHTSELGLEATLRVVSGGKRRRRGGKTPGGHANYVVARDGRVFRILDKQYRADHAGLSMWEGRRDISSFSVGIEIVGYHNAPLTRKQYLSVGQLVKVLLRVYDLPHRAVLTHSQVAYGRPNPWFRRNHRGRKRCAQNVDRTRLGLGPGYTYDPDVRAGRLQPDPKLAAIFYGRGRRAKLAATPHSPIISKQNSAWAIAGGEYNARTTAYLLPDGRMVPGNKVETLMGWNRLPLGTRVLLHQEPSTPGKVKKSGAIKTISHAHTAWSIAGQAYKAASTFYFLPSGKMAPGTRIQDWDDLPRGTRVIVGYSNPHLISRKKTAYSIAGALYKSPRVIYHIPSRGPVPGNGVMDFSQLEKGTRLFLPLP